MKNHPPLLSTNRHHRKIEHQTNNNNNMLSSRTAGTSKRTRVKKASRPEVMIGLEDEFDAPVIAVKKVRKVKATVNKDFEIDKRLGVDGQEQLVTDGIEMEKLRAKARIGYCKINVLTANPRIAWNAFNNRPLVERKVERLFSKFKHFGQQTTAISNLYTIIVEKSWITANTKPSIKGLTLMDLEGLKFVNDPNNVVIPDRITMCGGNHRRAATGRVQDYWIAERDTIKQNLEEIAPGIPLTDEDLPGNYLGEIREKWRRGKVLLSSVEKKLEMCPFWGIEILAKGKCINRSVMGSKC